MIANRENYVRIYKINNTSIDTKSIDVLFR